MKPFNPGDVVRRISHWIWTIRCGWEYVVEFDHDIHDEGNGCVTLVWHTWHYDREYFKLVESVNNTEDDLSNCTYFDYTHFKVWDIVIRNTERYEDSFMKKWNAYKITEIINKNVIKVEWSVKGYTSSYFHKIKFKFNVWDIVQSNSIHLKKWFNVRWKVHSLSQNWSYFYFENKDWSKAIANHRVKDFELVAECKDANSNNDGCVFDKNWKIDFLDFKPLRLNDFSVLKYYSSVGDSNSSNPIIPMSKTFNDYAVEAFMSNEDNRTNAINALATLNKLNDDLELVSDQIKKVKSVLISDIRRLQNAMSESYIDVISEMIKENPDVKEYVDRFMDNRLVSLIPESEAVVKSIQDKFK